MTEPLFTFVDDRGRPYTINQLAKDGRWTWRSHTKDTREHFGWLGVQAKVRAARLDRVTIDVVPLHANGRSPQDIAACAPHAKAAIDGLVDAGLIPDDNPRHLRLVTFHPPRICGIDGLELVIHRDEGPAPA